MEENMKRLFVAAGAAAALLLGGCTTTIRSDVTTFHQWPAQMADKSYAFEIPPPQEDTLEMRSYQELVRAQLARLGFHDSGADRPALLVSMRVTTIDVPVQVFFRPASDPFFLAPRYVFVGRHRTYLGGGWYGSSYYDPFLAPSAYNVEPEHRYQRELRVAIRAANDGKPLFDVTVRNVSSQLSTPKVMPALVYSAFEGFPGPNGVARRIELKEQNG
jgi:DUF1365 family protein